MSKCTMFLQFGEAGSGQMQGSEVVYSLVILSVLASADFIKGRINLAVY